MKRDDFKNYAAALRDKSAKFKRLKDRDGGERRMKQLIWACIR